MDETSEETLHHYLVLTWAEEPGDGTFTDNLDWQISHPPTCEVAPCTPDAWGEYRCAIQYEIDNVGVDAFGWKDADRLRCWSAVPAVFPIEHYHEVIRGLDWTEHDAGIRVVEVAEERDGGRIGGWHALIVLIVCITADMVARTIWGTP